VTGTTGSHQRVDKAAVLKLVVPDVRGLTKLTRKHIVSLVHMAQASRDEIAELTRTRDGLLALLMSGKVRVADVEAV
jgi:type I restriction enzyme S subunit